MNTSILFEPKAQKVKVNSRYLIVYFQDGRKLEIPLLWFPKLLKASPRQRNKYRLIGNGVGIHWTELDEDLSVNGLIGLPEDR